MTLKKMLAFLKMSSFSRGGCSQCAKINSSYFFFSLFGGRDDPQKGKKKNSWNFIFAAGILKRKKWNMTVIFPPKLGCLDPPKITVE
jgi:hypothetical protein